MADLPGFQFRNIQGINTYSFLRGIPNQNNLVLLLIDGIQVNELNSGGFYGGGQYNLSNIERIEVVYGPGSVAYGTNATSGIINLITRNTDENSYEINALAGSFNTLSNDFSIAQTNKKNNLGIRISGVAKYTEKANLKGSAGDYNWTDLMDNYERDYAFDIKISASNFLFGTNYLQKQSSGATYIKSVGTIYRDYGTLWNIRFINNYLKYQKQFENISLTATLYNRDASVLDNSVLYIVDTAQIGYYRPNNLTGIENILYYSNKNFSVASGLIFEYEQLAESYSVSISDSPDQSPESPENPDMEMNYLTSLFIEPEYTILKNIHISGGIRFDHSSIYDQVLTPRGGIIYKLKNQIVRFSYAEAYRAPKPWDYNDGLGNSSLLPERMSSLELALNLKLLKNLKLDIIGYKNQLEDAIVKKDEMDSYRWVNTGGISTNGLDLFLKYSSKSMHTILYYTFNDSYDESGKQVHEISKHTAGTNVTYALGKNIRFNIRANYIGKRENQKIITATNSRMIDPAIIFHGAISVINYTNFNIQFIARNIFDTEYYHTSHKEPERYRQSQRTLLLSLVSYQ